MRLRLSALLTLAVPALLAAQSANPAFPDSGTFVVLHGADTVVVETFSRSDTQVNGMLVNRAAENKRERFQGTLIPDGTLPLVNFWAWRGEDAPDVRARQMGRVIFKDDSAAVDELASGAMGTRLFETHAGAVPYINLSFAMLEQATRRAVIIGGDTTTVYLFSMNGGETAPAKVTRFTPDSVTLAIGSVTFRLWVDAVGRLLGGGIPEQGVRVVRK
jgi:hypothetical protein